jgi:hypothetical protein
MIFPENVSSFSANRPRLLVLSNADWSLAESTGGQGSQCRGDTGAGRVCIMHPVIANKASGEDRGRRDSGGSLAAFGEFVGKRCFRSTRWPDILVRDGAVGSGSALRMIARSGPFQGEEVVGQAEGAG